MNRPTASVHPALLVLLLLVGSGSSHVARAEDPPPFEPLPEGLEPAAYFEFGASADNRCMMLSPGGKLAWVRNRHPSMALRYRMIRLYAGAPQAGRVAGLLPPGPEGIKLGCNLVTEREQRWDVERASLEPWQPPAPAADAAAAPKDAP